MSARKNLSKRTRFEVFKRDAFTCQYCGAKAPDAVLHVDHINPVANGGDNAIMNLVTACAACNGGKGARLLDDRSAVERQRAQIEDLQSRREQLEMMLKWRDAEQAEAVDTVAAICDRVGERGGFMPSENGKQMIRRWLKRYSVAEVLAALDEAFDAYMRFDGNEPIVDAWETAFSKVPAIAGLRRQAVEKPYVMKLAYIQAILRRRLHDPRGNYFEALETYTTRDNVPTEVLEDIAKVCSSWDDFGERAFAWFKRQVEAEPAVPAPPTEVDRYLAWATAPRAEPEAAFPDDGYDNDGCDD